MKKIRYEHTGDGGEVIFSKLNDKEVEELMEYIEENYEPDWYDLPGNLKTIFHTTGMLGCRYKKCGINKSEVHKFPKEDGYYLFYSYINTSTLEFDIEINDNEEFEEKKFSVDVAYIELGSIASYPVYFNYYYNGEDIKGYLNSEIEEEDDGSREYVFFRVKDQVVIYIDDDGFFE